MVISFRVSSSSVEMLSDPPVAGRGSPEPLQVRRGGEGVACRRAGGVEEVLAYVVVEGLAGHFLHDRAEGAEARVAVA
ncbi:hypothetical protein ACWDA3_47675 [Nonomuraea rubra]